MQTFIPRNKKHPSNGSKTRRTKGFKVIYFYYISKDKCIIKKMKPVI